MKKLLSSIKKGNTILYFLLAILSVIMILLIVYLVYYGVHSENIIGSLLLAGIMVLLLILFWLKALIL